MKTIEQEIEELRRLTTPELVDRYEEVFGKPPRVKNRAWLWRRLSWRIQEKKLGGLSEIAKQRLEELIAELDLPLDERLRTVSGRLSGNTRAVGPRPGTVFTRTWHGREVRAVAVQGGFECDGVIYKSLSAVARALTGARWNGKLLFGLTERKRK